jgi:hypothetical protein
MRIKCIYEPLDKNGGTRFPPRTATRAALPAQENTPLTSVIFDGGFEAVQI